MQAAQLVLVHAPFVDQQAREVGAQSAVIERLRRHDKGVRVGQAEALQFGVDRHALTLASTASTLLIRTDE